MTKFQFTGTGAQPHRNRKMIQFDRTQYCTVFSALRCAYSERTTFITAHVYQIRINAVYYFMALGIPLNLT